MRSGQTAEPEWFTEGRVYWEGVKLGEEHVKIKIGAKESIKEPSLLVDVIAAEDVELPPSVEDQVTRYLVKLFTLDYDLESFYTEFDKDIIAETFPYMRGLRLMKGGSPFRSLICSILSQNASVLQWNKWARKIAELLSKPVRYRDKSICYPFPDSNSIASTSIESVRDCGLGYRSRYVVEASSNVASGEMDLLKLGGTSFIQAKSRLMRIPGIGPKVADCFLLYGLGFGEVAPVDVWIHRIVSHTYFKGSEVDREEVGRFLRSRYGSYAGLAQLYLYHYGRKIWRRPDLVDRTDESVSSFFQ